MVPMSGIDKIAELVDLLNADEHDGGGTVRYEVPGGPVIGNGLHKTTEVAVQLVFVPAGAEFPKHLHGETETLVVYRGELTLKSGMDVVVLRPGESMTYPPGVPHSASAKVDTCVVAVTVPGGEGFPDAEY